VVGLDSRRRHGVFFSRVEIPHSESDDEDESEDESEDDDDGRATSARWEEAMGGDAVARPSSSSSPLEDDMT